MADLLTVTALNRYVKARLDGDDFLFDLALRGEINQALEADFSAVLLDLAGR